MKNLRFFRSNFIKIKSRTLLLLLVLLSSIPIIHAQRDFCGVMEQSEFLYFNTDEIISGPLNQAWLNPSNAIAISTGTATGNVLAIKSSAVILTSTNQLGLMAPQIFTIPPSTIPLNPFWTLLQDPVIVLPNTPFKFDRFGNTCTMVNPEETEATHCGGDCFELNFTSESANIAFTDAQEETICAVFQYLSSLICCNGVATIEIRAVSNPTNPGEAPPLATGSPLFLEQNLDTEGGCNFLENVAIQSLMAGEAPIGISGLIAIDVSDANTWHTIDTNNPNAPVPSDAYDLYSVVLHEAMHVLGMASMLGADGTPFANHYTSWDLLLQYSGGSVLDAADSDGACCYQYAPTDDNDFPDTILEDLENGDVSLGGFVSVCGHYNSMNDPAMDQSLFLNMLSHLDDDCNEETQSDLILSSEIDEGESRRVISTAELQILCAMGYCIQPQAESGMEGCADDDYCYVLAVDDGPFYVTLNSTESIPVLANLLVNDLYEGIADWELDLNCGDASGIAINPISGSIEVTGLEPGSYEFCYQLEACNGECSVGTVHIIVTPTALEEECIPTDCDLHCYGGFEDFVVDPDLTTTTNNDYLDQLGLSSYIVNGAFSNTADILAFNGNQVLHVIAATSESITIPLTGPIEAGCTVTVSFDVTANNLLTGQGCSPVNLIFLGSQNYPCSEVTIPTSCTGNVVNWCTSGFAHCMEGVHIPCTGSDDFVSYEFTWTHEGISDLNYLTFFVNSNQGGVFMDNLSVKSSCTNSISITNNAPSQMCAGDTVNITYEICADEGTPLTELTLTPELPAVTDITIAGDFSDGTATVEVSDGNCVTLELILTIGEGHTGNEKLDIGMDVSTESDHICLESPEATGFCVTIGGDDFADFEYEYKPCIAAVCFNSFNIKGFHIWDFGDGQTSNQANPEHTYTEAGTYVVAHTINTICGTFTEEVTIEIEEALADASFEVIQNGCAAQVTFVAQQQEGQVIHNWSICNQAGSQIDVINGPAILNYTFPGPGVYTVKYILVFNDCPPSTTSVNVEVGDNINADFTVNQEACSLEVTANGINYPGIVHTWNFYAGNILLDQVNGFELWSIDYSFPSTGTYQIQHIITTDCGTDSHTISVSVEEGDTDPSFQIVDQSCDGTYVFQGVSGNWTHSWRIFNASGMVVTQASTNNSPTWSYTFDTEGTYTVQHAISSACGDELIEIEISVTIAPEPNAFFQVNQLYCFPSVTFIGVYNANSTNIWTIQGNGSNNSINTGYDAFLSYDFPAEGTYQVTHTVINECGSASHTESVMVNTDIVDASFEIVEESCDGMYTFEGVFGDWTHTWRILDASGMLIVQQNLGFNPVWEYTFNMEGTYTVQHTINSDCGNEMSQIEITVVITPQPNAAFQISQTACLASVGFFGVSNANSANTWTIQGNGVSEFINTGSSSTLSYTFPSTGTYQVSHTVTNSCGSDTYVESVDIFLEEPDANFTYEIDCENPYNTTFTSNSADLDNTTFNWDFGNGVSGSGASSSYNYNTEGTYNIVHTVSNECGQVAVVQDVDIVCTDFSCPCEDETLNIGEEGATTYISELIGTVLPSNGTYSGCLAIHGSLIIDEDMTFFISTLKMQPGSGIGVLSGVDLSIGYSNIHGCVEMWQGIILQQGARLGFYSNTIKDAIRAISLNNNASYYIQHNTFDRNYTGMYVTGTPNPEANLIGNTFTCTACHALSPVIGASPGLLPPYEGQITQYGIDLSSANFDVGALNSTPNQFIGIRKGIRGFNSSFSVYNNQFEHLIDHGITSFEGLLFVGNNQFNDCFAGVFNNQSIMTIGDNQFSDCTKGIDVNAGADETISIYNNMISNFERLGIKVTGAQVAANIYIAENELEVSEYYNQELKSIQLLASTSSMAMNGSITQNIINMNNVRRAIGISNSGCNNVNITGNEITLGEHEWSRGINLFNTSGCNIKDNQIIFPNLFEDAYGIYIREGTANIVCCNNISGAEYGAYFIGFSPTTIRQNVLYGTGTAGLYVRNISNETGQAIIGEQVHAGNQWCSSNAIHTGAFPEVEQSEFTVNPADNSPACAISPSASPAYWFQDSPGTTPNCGTNTDCEIIRTIPNENPNFPFPSILANNIDRITIVDHYAALGQHKGRFATTDKWTAQRYLYSKLYQNPDLLGQETTIDSFYNRANASNLADFHQVDIEISRLFAVGIENDVTLKDQMATITTNYAEIARLDSLLVEATNEQDSIMLWSDRMRQVEENQKEIGAHLALLEDIKKQRLAQLPMVIALNAALAPSIQAEKNQKIMNAYFLASYERGGINTLTTIERAELANIAGQCARIGGAAVARARNILEELGEAIAYDDMLLCMDEDCLVIGDSLMEDSNNNGIKDSCEMICIDNRVLTEDAVAGSHLTYESSNTITSLSSIKEGANITYDASDCVTLFPNFEVAQGAELTIRMEGCEESANVSNGDIQYNITHMEDVLQIDYQLKESASVEVIVYDLYGVVKAKTIQKDGTSIKINTKDFIKGLYHLEIIYQDTSLKEKLIISN